MLARRRRRRRARLETFLEGFAKRITADRRDAALLRGDVIVLLGHVGEVDLRQALLLAQAEQHDPLRARGAAALGAVIDEVAQQPRTFYELRNQLAFQIERHSLGGAPQSLPIV